MHHTRLSKVQVVRSGMGCPTIKILEICSRAGGLGQ